ncbi:hypothetical protein [Fretibacter rubidus]|uniref:hypothetical protein n=1 Tax=Fretibacter rubidus TaxID=570162 RepID=UPI00352B1E57
MKAALTALWRMFHALAFYPLMLGLFIWLYIKDAHWGLGLAVVIMILVFDPIWRILAQSLWSKRPRK